jgi:pilus assembly protein CpaC
MEILVKLVPGGEKAVINLMNIEPQQVLLCVKVMEISRNKALDLGINWEVLYQTACRTIALGAVYPSPPSTDPNYFFKTDVKSGNYNITSLINMLEENGFAKVLAKPNLTTTAGTKATFFSGGEFPVLIPQGGQLIGTVTVEYKKYGVMLEFIPDVDMNGLITLHVVPEVSNLDKQNSVVYSGFVIPALITRRVDTIVKLWPGQSYIIAGLYLDELTDKKDSLYGLNRIPIIGSLFASDKFQEARTELLVVVTPYLINNMNGYQAPQANSQECCLSREEQEQIPYETLFYDTENPPPFLEQDPNQETPWECFG